MKRKNRPKPKTITEFIGVSSFERHHGFEGKLPASSTRHGLMISCWTPLIAPLEYPHQVDEFRRDVGVERELVLFAAPDVPRKALAAHLRWRVSQIRGELNLALYKMGMLDTALCCNEAQMGLTWIEESLPALAGKPVLRPFGSFYYLKAAQYAEGYGCPDLGRSYAAQGIKLLPPDARKVLWAPELYRLLAESYLQGGNSYYGGIYLNKAVRATSRQKACPPVLWHRLFRVAEDYYGAISHESSRLRMIAKLKELKERFTQAQLCPERAERMMEFNVRDQPAVLGKDGFSPRWS